MKKVEIKNGFVLDTICEFLSQEELSDSSRVFIDAPDNVWGGWGYINGKFIKPTAPMGWMYINKVNCLAPKDIEERKKLGMRTDLIEEEVDN